MMEINKQQNDARQVHELYWKSYITGDINTLASLLDEHYTQVGSVEGEVFQNKKDAVRFIEETIDQINGKVDMRNRITKLDKVGNLVLLSERCDLYALIDNTWTFYAKFRASTLLHEKNGKWLIIHQHSSMPDTRADEGENIALDKIAAENLQLKEAVKRRTIELEHQNRELEIEAALERVRATSLAMHHSAELSRVVTVLLSQLVDLRLSFNAALIWTFDREKKDIQIWIATPALPNPVLVKLPYDEEFRNNQIIEQIWHSVDQGIDTINQVFTGQIKNRYYDYAIKYNDEKVVPHHLRERIYNLDWTVTYAAEKNSLVGLDSWSGQLLSNHDFQILKRFAKVFEQAYTRFLDLQKAEAQAREAKIEAALERIRASAMAMHSSEGILEVTQVLREQIALLGEKELESILVHIYQEDTDQYEGWYSYRHPENRHEQIRHGRQLLSWSKTARARKDKEKYYEEATDYTIVADYSMLKEWYDYLLTMIPEVVEVDKDGKPLVPTVLYYNYSKIAGGALLLITNSEASDHSKYLLRRAATVFNLAYSRFLDLQKAEAQAREAQIEVSLERVRARAMAMQRSDELKELIGTVFTEMTRLDIALTRTIIMTNDSETRDSMWWMANQEAPDQPMGFFVPYHEHKPYQAYMKAWDEKAVKFLYVLEGQDKIDWDNYLFSKTGLAEMPDFVIAGMRAPERVYLHASFNNFGNLTLASLEPLPEEHFDILLRFAKVFDLTYTRFNDLRIAEIQTHKAKIETALERVRARALAMQAPEELIEVSEVLRYEMGLLGVEELETCSIYLHKENTASADCWYAIKDTRYDDKRLVSDHFTLQLSETWVGREMLKFFESDNNRVSIRMKGELRKEWINYCEERSVVLKGYYGTKIPDRTYHLYKFSQGAIGAAAAGKISAESWDLLQRAAAAFSLAYSRFRDLTQARHDLQNLKEEKQRAEAALKELKAAQTQLIQAEKMASLGELTAGIAHEIQNPLNFVNNFSEVNIELAEEIIDTIEKGDFVEAKELAIDIRTNQEKIREHGKRADGIVKSMLQHSRTSTGQKEPRDLATLADEYLRLSYHGMRAKDKTFNSDFELIADPDLPMVNIVPQDIGRVMLNLINNGFYAAHEKKKISSDEYKPKLTVTLSKEPEYIQIRISDNGTGIPEKVKEKIFQPFFTTKPTGEGTGLGLSLSYDIVTKGHAGSISVETSESSGTSFTILLPSSG